MHLIIIFSFNRSAQLDYHLTSLIKNYKSDNYEVAIIYHFSNINHSKGYSRVQEKFHHYKNIKFHEREKTKFGFRLINFWSFWNFKKIIKHSFLLNRNPDNFKPLLEKIIGESSAMCVSFNTDDSCYFSPFSIDENVIKLVTSDPLQSSYRLYLGINLEGVPEDISVLKEQNLCRWKYNFDSNFNHWRCSFSVDGTLYDRKSILSILKRVAYHNPITLEAYVYDYVRKKGFLNNGYSPIHSKLVCTKLNRVSQDSYNPTIQIDVNTLNQKYLEGYILDIQLPKDITNANLVPEKVFLVKNEERIMIYECDTYGVRVQNALGPEGTRYIVD